MMTSILSSDNPANCSELKVTLKASELHLAMKCEVAIMTPIPPKKIQLKYFNETIFINAEGDQHKK